MNVSSPRSRLIKSRTALAEASLFIVVAYKNDIAIEQVAVSLSADQ